MRVFSIFALTAMACLGLVSAALAAPAAGRPIQMDRLLGRWYEIARTPNDRQKGCVATSAQWTQGQGGKVEVVNRCRKVNGKVDTFQSTARAVDSMKGRISMAFFAGVLSQEYLILDHGDSYDWSIMATPNRKFVWVFSRRPSLPPAEVARLMTRVRALGLDPTKLELPAG